MPYWTIEEEPSVSKHSSGKPRRRFFAVERNDLEQPLRKIGPVHSRIKAIGLVARTKPDRGMRAGRD